MIHISDSIIIRVYLSGLYDTHIRFDSCPHVSVHCVRSTAINRDYMIHISDLIVVRVFLSDIRFDSYSHVSIGNI